MPKIISKFFGEYAFLSNFSDHPVTMQGPFPTLEPTVFPTAEHAYQAAKATTREDFEKVVSAPTPGVAKKIGRRIKVRGGWEDVKISVMAAVVEAKFAAGSQLATQLLETGSATLVEGNEWGDDFWGAYKGRGVNMLGVILMDRRSELLAATQDVDYAREYEAAMMASNAAGCVGMTPSDTIRYLSAELARRNDLMPGGEKFKDNVRHVFLANGFTVKEGQSDLKDYVFNAAAALLNSLAE